LSFLFQGIQLMKTAENNLEKLTKYKKTENELKESEKRYHTLIETITQGIEEIDTSGRITLANSSLHKMYGYSQGELVGKSILDLVATDSERKELRDYLAVLVNKQPPPASYEGQKITKDGKILDVKVHWDYKREGNGHLSGFVSVITDITDHKKEEEELQRIYEYLDNILFNLPVGIAILEGPEFRYFRINRMLAEINGLDVEDHLGRPLKEVLPDAAANLLPRLQKVLETGKSSLNFEFSIRLPKDLSEDRHFIDSFFPIKNKDGKITAVGAVVLDTKRTTFSDCLN